SFPTPTCLATASTAAVIVGYSARCSITRRTARALTSGSICFGMLPSSWTQTGAASNLGRFTLHTGADLLTDRQRERIEALFATDEHVEVEATWGIYQRMIGAYREPDRAKGRQLMAALIESLSHGVPAALSEVITLGRTLKRRAADVLAYFDRPGTSNGPTEAINGRLEHLREIGRAHV